MAYENATPISNKTLGCSPHDVYFLHVPRDLHYDNFLLAMIVINAVMAVVASCSNAVVIYTISRTPSLQTPSNILILGLAISDLSVGVFAQPCFCYFKYTELRRNFDFYCSLGDVYTFSTLPLGAISFLTLSAITADRFLAVYLHLRYKDIITTKRAGIALGFIWFIGVCYAVYSGVFYSLMAVNVLNFCIATTLLFLNMYFIFRVCVVIYRHSLQIRSQQPAQQSMNMTLFKNSAKVMFLVIGAFILSYAPYGLSKLVSIVVHRHSYGIRIVFNISITLVMFNGILNPIIYCWRIEGIRTASVVLMRKMWRRDVN